jgi:c-di-GMP phosphodiesterase
VRLSFIATFFKPHLRLHRYNFKLYSKVSQRGEYTKPMNFKSTLYIIISISILLLSFSLYTTFKTIEQTNLFIGHIEDKSLILDKETLQDLSHDANKLIVLSENELKTDISSLRKIQDKSTKDTLYSFIMAVILILFVVYKLSLLHTKSTKELQKAEETEEELHKLQAQLLQYNEDLEQEISKKAQELHNKIYTHFLTTLPNRNKLLEDTHDVAFQQMALLNIDKFQKFNDIYGEEIGNIAIQMSASFLKEQIDDTNTLLYHIGGDEFVIAVKNSSAFYNMNFIRKIENILQNYADETFLYQDKKFNFIMSAGISFSGDNKMLAYADMALKDAKKRNIPLSVFSDDKELERIHQDDIDCHKKLLKAFETENVISFYQPIVPIQDDTKETKYESLVRIIQEDGTIIAPFNFIKVAKANRLYHKLTKVVLNNTLDMIQKYKVPCSLNISIDDIDDEQTLQMLYKKFDQFEYNELLTIELLETEEFKDYLHVYEFCIKVRSYGIKMALDDFGSGYSNFSHVLNLPIDYIKIDSSLISNIDRDENSKRMVETIVSLAKKLHVQTIAEFVSSQEIYDIVKELEVDYAQGYYLGKPEPIENHLKH